RFGWWAGEFSLLLGYPARFADDVCSGHIKARRSRCGQTYAAIRRMNREVDVLDILSRHNNRQLANLDRVAHWYPPWFFIISKIACVAVRSRLRIGTTALSTCFSRVSSPFHPAGACSRMVVSISSANAAFWSSSKGHWKVVAGMLARLLNRTIASGLPWSAAGIPAVGWLPTS